MTLVPNRVNLFVINQMLKVSENLIFKFRILIGRQHQWRHRSERIWFRNERFPILLNPVQSQQQFPSVKQIQRSFWSQMVDSSVLQKTLLFAIVQAKKCFHDWNKKLQNILMWANEEISYCLTSPKKNIRCQNKIKTPKTYQTDFSLT